MEVPHTARRLLCLVALAVAACGGRSPVFEGSLEDGGAAVQPTEESCNGADDDLDGRVDESFRDARGRYLHDDHCGGCGIACDMPGPNAEGGRCDLVGDVATCVATACAPGFGVSTAGRCIPVDERLCLPCAEDADCGALPSARCVEIRGQKRCLVGCENGCPFGYRCQGGVRCEPAAGSCVCSADSGDFESACSLDEAGRCIGRTRCQGGVLLACQLPNERCDGLDNDCDGEADEGFLDTRGVYSSDADCGACGRDCAADDVAGIELTCGGDPFAPSCITSCPDARDGVQVGDRLDADGRIDNGCECTVRALLDEGGAGSAGQLDENCDGADGQVLSSYYVATDGDDAAPGSPARPLRSIGEAVRRAGGTLGNGPPRLDVYVASGIYTETVELREGVRLHGGYRRDFLARNPGGFEVVVLAPADTGAPGGAALFAEGVGSVDTLVEGFSFRGRDADAPGGAAFGAVLLAPGPGLRLSQVSIRSGRPGAGRGGDEGAAGASPTTRAGHGAPQRAAVEDAAHACVDGAANVVRGGPGGRNRCGNVDVSGGVGGSPGCPVFNEPTPGGEPGRGDAAAPGGAAGGGSANLEGPIGNDGSCGDGSVCCGLADFRVPRPFPQPQAGAAGSDGVPGTAGAACTDPIGSLDDGDWIPALARAGTAGRPGGGGGGGGAGGGVEMDWIAGECEWPDGLPGAGGGGGAAGCGGEPGTPGQSGGPAVALVMQLDPGRMPQIDGLRLIAEDGAAGGDGGSGGDGGTGGAGGFGGRLPDAERTTPPVAGPLPGERGGKGGNGGAGGGAGGGCGGSSFGAWLTGSGATADRVAALRAASSFVVGNGGEGGLGGGGAVPGDEGADGSTGDVQVR